jgi:hypothetical protein
MPVDNCLILKNGMSLKKDFGTTGVAGFTGLLVSVQWTDDHQHAS